MTIPKTAGRGTFVPLVFQPGEAFQFDWSEDWATIAGENTKLQVAHIKLSHSRAFLLRAYLLQTHEMLFDAHRHAFPVFGGVPGLGIYDIEPLLRHWSERQWRGKTAVDRVGSGKARQVNARFLAMTSHYLFEPEFCNPAAGWEKGQVEKSVQDARHLILQLMPDFPDLAALNAWLEQRCIEQWERTPHGTLPGTVAEVWQAEKTALMPTPPAFDGFVEQSKRVSPTCLISFERNRYSFPASFAKGNDKGHIEGGIGFGRRNFLVPIPHSESFEALNTWLEEQCLGRRNEVLRGHGETIGERLMRELDALLPLWLPSIMFVHGKPALAES